MSANSSGTPKKPKKKKPGGKTFTPPPGLPSLAILLTVMTKADAAMKALSDDFKVWMPFLLLDPKGMTGRWKKLVPKLGGAIRKLLSGTNLPPILAAISGKATDLSDRDAVVQALEEGLGTAQTLVKLFTNLLIFHKSQYFGETTGFVTDLRGLIVNSLFDADQRHQVQVLCGAVFAVSDEIAKEMATARTTNKKIGEIAVQKAEDAKKDPALEAKDLQIKAMQGGSITAADVADAAPRQALRRNPSSKP